TAAGRLDQVLFHDGSQVHAGELLVRLSDLDLAARMDAARLRRRQAELALQELVDGPTASQLDRARAAVARAGAEVKAGQVRADALAATAADGHASGAELDAARRALDAARWEQKAAEVALRLMEAGAAGEAIAGRRAEAEEARATEAALARQWEAGAIRAPRDGEWRAPDLSLRLGAWIQPGETLGEVAGGRSFRFDGRFSELDAEDLRPGLKVQVRLPIPGSGALEGRLESVGERFEPIAGRRAAAVRVYGAVDDPAGTAREGARARLEVEHGRATLARKAGRWLRQVLANHGP
ncbi:MAG TPA: HlyD family efflux transporter periplasmic adaptor subunit, partial [Myxococcales bacterium]|nr:HlyD family efflux transporter periplasmic adaptor subunit [Myxococcales bacterium]